MFKKIFLLVAVIILFFSCSERTLPPPEGLLCELLRYPEKAVITDSIPEFSWVFPQEGIKQTACRILVATTLDLLEEGESDYWDCGKLNTNESVNLEFEGKPLISNSSYWWKVKVWDQQGKESRYSQPQQFHTSKFSKTNEVWPGKSDFVLLSNEGWVSENRQTSTFHSNKPVDYKEVEEGRWFADFGKASFATLELLVNSRSDGDSIIVYLGERKNLDLTVNKNPGRSNIGFQKVIIVLNEEVHNYKIEIPTHHSSAPNTQKLAPFYSEVLPFRYVEIIASGDKIHLKNINRLSLYYPFDDDASFFNSSDKNLNRVWDLCKYTLKATPFLGVYADGNRERMPYEADSYIQQLGHYCVDREFSIGRYTTNFLMYNPSWPTEWNMHIVLMAWQDYMHTGNKEFLSKMYNELKNKTLFALAREDGLISTTMGKVTPEFLNSINKESGIQDIVDWPKGTPVGSKQAGNAGPTPEGERDGYVFTDFNTVVNSFHYQTLVIMAKIAKKLDKVDDEELFISRAKKVKKSFQNILFDKRKGIFVDGEGTKHSSLHANMFPLAFNLVPPENSDTVVEFIKSRGMACSVYGVQYLLEGLFNTGEAEYAISLMTSDSKRSWINMLNVGSTMTTEAWDEYYKPNLTWNHAWGSAPANIIPRKLLGIEPVKPGFEKFKIVPQPGKLKKIELRMPSIRGTIDCNLSIREETWEMEVSIPGNSSAEVWLPAAFNTIEINSKISIPERTEYFAGMDRKIFFLQSGNYSLFAE